MTDHTGSGGNGGGFEAISFAPRALGCSGHVSPDRAAHRQSLGHYLDSGARGSLATKRGAFPGRNYLALENGRSDVAASNPAAPL